ncbi:MAG: C10 family peptidase [Bacteroidales bacterium]|nr:C10 family peptidase [Bacteroidales bacterium]
MRKYTFIAILITLSMTAMAKHVDLETAKSVAATFWEKNVQKSNTHRSGYEFYDITSQTEFSNIYIFNTNGGVVIVSADDVAKPILGYSQQGTFNPENIPTNAKSWLRNYCDEIQYAIDNNIETGVETREAWNNLRNGIALAPKSTRTVSQLLTTTWNQRPYYNELCPFDEEEGERSVTGCVATAMAQVMKYWNWPARGTGSHSYTSDDHPEQGILSADFGNTTYEWDNMPNALTEGSSPAEINAVATLMYHCGVSVEMMYSAVGSGAYTITYYGQLDYCSENALRDFFGYSNDLHGEVRMYRYEDENGDTLTYDLYPHDDWVAMLKEDLDALRPILYTGHGNIGGHAFVFDGYDNNDLFHVNWGWGGYADGYFEVDALEPDPGGIGGGDYLFYLDHTAVFGVEPAYTTLAASPRLLTINANGDAVTFNIYASNIPQNCNISCDQPWVTLSNTTATGYGETTPITLTAEPNTSGETRYATITITQGSYTTTISVTQNDVQYTITVLSENTEHGEVYGGGTFDEGTEIEISATAHDGYQFLAWNDDNTDNPRTITVTEDATYTAYFVEISDIEENNASKISIFPNPTSDMLNIISSEEISSVEIVNIIGQVVLYKEVNSTSTLCNLKGIDDGIYFIRIHGKSHNDIIGNQKFVKAN